MPTKIPDSPTIRIAPDVKLGENVKIYAFVNLYGCSVGDDTRIGTFVEIQKGASVGRSCKISSHTFICEGVHIEDECFIGHGVMFINDLYPHATAENGIPQTEQDWKVAPTYVRRRASIGSNATILGGVTIGEGAIVGAGAVVTRDVPAGTIVAGSPARVLRKVDQPRESTERVGRYDVPFLDLKAQYVQIKDEVHAAMNNVMETSAFVLGEAVKNFEGAFAAHHGAQYCVATSCGTSALHVALLAMGIGSGDEVIVPVNTFIATAGAVSHCGAKPVFVDMDEKDYCIDPQKIARAVTPRTKVVIPVHLYGQPAEMDQIMAIAEQYGLKILEDCAQAHDAEYRGRKVGTFGVAGAFSFYPGKNLGAYGEGGAVLTNDEALAAKMRMLRDHGSAKKYYHDMVGYNYRMHGFQGAVLGVKLKYLVAWTDARRRIAKRYEQLLSAHGALVKQTKPYVRHVYHLFVVRVKNRDKVAAILKDQGVATGIHYPIPLHLTRAYADLGYKKGDFPVTEAAADELLSLPMYPELTDEMINYVAVSLKQALWA